MYIYIEREWRVKIMQQVGALNMLSYMCAQRQSSTLVDEHSMGTCVSRLS